MAAARLEIKGGNGLKAVLARMADSVANADHVRVGFLEGAKYPDGLSIAQVAFWNEFGTIRAPARPFFRTMIATKSPGWGKALSLNLKATHYDGTQTLQRMGEGIKDQLVTSIVGWTAPPNAPSTIARKGFNKPLIDTGTMQRAPDFNVVTR